MNRKLKTGMRRVRELIFRFVGLFNKGCKDHELDEEIESHLQMHIEDNLRTGMTREEARRQALIKLGGIESTKEACRDQRGLPVLEVLWQDIRYGIRMMRKNSGFTTVAVLTLALGIGVNTAIFTVLNALILRPLPFCDSNQVVRFVTESEFSGSGRLSFSAYLDFCTCFHENRRIHSRIGSGSAAGGMCEYRQLAARSRSSPRRRDCHKIGHWFKPT